MSSLQPDVIAITCSTYYPNWYQGPLRSIHHTDKIRGDLDLEFIEKALNKGYFMIVTDGLSTKTFQKKLRSFNNPHLYVLKRKTLGRSAARRLAFSRAAKIPGVKAIIYSEAEKVSLLDFIPQIIKPIISGDADMVIPKRETKLFESTYPLYMVESEEEGNMLYNEYLHLHGLLPKEEQLDMFFGPRVFGVNKRILSLFYARNRYQVGPHVLNEHYFNPEELSDALFFPVVVALKRKLKVTSVSIPFRYPLLQKQNEELGQRKFFEEKRKMQRLSLLVELMHFLNYLDRQKK